MTRDRESIVPSPWLVNEFFAIARNGTPVFYVLDFDQIAGRYEQVRLALGQHFPSSSIAYSYKTNNLRAITAQLRGLGAGAEVVSGAELSMAVEDGFAGSEIHFNGPVKSRADVELAVSIGARMNADSIAQLEMITGVARSAGKRPNLGLRLAAPYHNRSSRFGVTPDELSQCLTMLAADGIALAGIHLHVGSNLKDSERHRDVLVRFLPELLPKRAQFSHPFTIDVGGGLPALSFDQSAPLPTVDGFIAEIAACLRDYGIDFDGIHVVAEPGRALVEDAGYLVTEVASVGQSNGKATLTTFAGTNLVRSIRSWHHPLWLYTADADNSPGQYDIFGSNCFEEDIFALDKPSGSSMRAGDLVVVGSAGGYDFPSANIWIMPAPPVFKVAGLNVTEIRRQQAVRDMRALHV